MNRDFNAEAAALPRLQFDTLMHGYMIRTFKPHFDGVRALELGCFEGAMSGLLAAEFSDLTIVDASVENIVTVKMKYPQAKCHLGRFEDVQLEGQFQNILLVHSLEHVDEPYAVLNRCREWLEPNGKLFIAVPNAYAASRQIAVRMGLLPQAEAVMPAEAEHGHKRTYTPALLCIHAQGARLKILSAGGILFKALSGAQMDQALATGIIDKPYLDACFEMGKRFPELCSSTYVVCERGP